MDGFKVAIEEKGCPESFDIVSNHGFSDSFWNIRIVKPSLSNQKLKAERSTQRCKTSATMICRRYAKKLECSEVDLTMVLSAPLGVSSSRCPKTGGAAKC